MNSWVPWLFPLGLLVTVVVFAVFGAYVGLGLWVAAGGLGLWLWTARVSRRGSDPDRETRYWRFGDWIRGG